MAVAMSAACSAYGQAALPEKKESSITLYGGFRGGGSLTDEDTGTTMDVQSSASYALAVDIGIDRQTQVQLFYGHQHTALSSGTFAPTADNLDLSLDYFHLGGVPTFSRKSVPEPTWQAELA